MKKVGTFCGAMCYIASRCELAIGPIALHFEPATGVDIVGSVNFFSTNYFQYSVSSVQY